MSRYTTPDHGSRRGYTTNKCRCELCVAWNTERCKDYRERAKAGEKKQRAKGSGPEHGTSSGYAHHGCRCQVCVEAHNARNRAEYERNKETHRQKFLRWRRTEKGLLHYRLAQQVHHKKLKGQDKVTKQYASLLVNDPCSYCGGPGGVIEHIQSSARGGGTGWMNLTAACASCNARKRSRTLVEFLRYMQKR